MQEFKRNKPSIEKTEANLSLYTLEKGIPYKIDVTEGLEGDTDLSSLEIQAIEKGGPWGTLSVKKFFTSGSTRDEEYQLFETKQHCVRCLN